MYRYHLVANNRYNFELFFCTCELISNKNWALKVIEQWKPRSVRSETIFFLVYISKPDYRDCSAMLKFVFHLYG
jgi:hypothetical protein